MIDGVLFLNWRWFLPSSCKALQVGIKQMFLSVE